ncbi:hypothetical protein [Paraburkholderia rhizosphaerae]|uniref:Uncharacterized protein n=1 Tax=Paraburkholderia rhizosphaerae TaxID=480658 RepID=A0A4R8L4E0_9BURK|nr:hypothetical protein [Paraburkholderia rhizosphaerae]TDY37466.1 hypothetical protein BX592_13721 [Paraburkholderia rhizosphaerae]
MHHPMQVELVNDYSGQALRVSIDRSVAMLDAPDLDALIEHLALLRAKMHPEIPQQVSRQHKYVIEIDPCWYTEKNAIFEGAVMFFRHTGFNWTGFAVPKESLIKLIDALSQHVDECQETYSMPN